MNNNTYQKSKFYDIISYEGNLIKIHEAYYLMMILFTLDNRKGSI